MCREKQLKCPRYLKSHFPKTLTTHAQNTFEQLVTLKLVPHTKNTKTSGNILETRKLRITLPPTKYANKKIPQRKTSYLCCGDPEQGAWWFQRLVVVMVAWRLLKHVLTHTQLRFSPVSLTLWLSSELKTSQINILESKLSYSNFSALHGRSPWQSFFEQLLQYPVSQFLNSPMPQSYPAFSVTFYTRCSTHSLFFSCIGPTRPQDQFDFLGMQKLPTNNLKSQELVKLHIKSWTLSLGTNTERKHIWSPRSVT